MSDLQQNPPADRQVLGTLMRDKDRTLASLGLMPGMFDGAVNIAVAHAIERRMTHGDPWSITSLALSLTLELKDVGGEDYLLGLLVDSAPGGALEQQAQIVLESWQRRALHELAVRVIGLAQGVVSDVLGSTPRASAQSQVMGFVGCLADEIAFGQTILRPPPPLLSGDPRNISLLVPLLPMELNELANNHDLQADSDQRAGRNRDAGIRRNRAEQLRQMLGAPA